MVHGRGWVPFAVCLVGLLALGACGDDDEGGGGGGDSEASGSNEPCPDGAADSTLTMRVQVQANGLDPIINNGAGVAGGSEEAAIYDTLMRFDPEEGTFEPRVAESLESNDDFTEWTMVLRDGVLFGNGDPLTADDVITSILRHRDDEENQSPVVALAKFVDTMEAVDDHTVRFELTDPWAGFPVLLAGPAGMITNQKVIDELGGEQFNLLPKGAGVGPFEPERFAPGEETVLTRRTDYWGGEVCVGTLRFISTASGETALDALDKGEVDVSFLREPVVIASANDKGYDSFSSLQNLGSVMLMNTGAAPTDDLRVRKAIVAAIDPAQVDERVNDGKGLPSSAIISEKSIHYDGLEGPEYDLDEAKSQLAEAKADGYDGKIRLLCANNPATIEQSIIVQGQLEAAGFDVELTNNAAIGDVITAIIVEHDFDVACWGENTPDDYLWAPLNDYLHTDGSANRTSYSDAAMDKALDELRAAADEDAEQEALSDIQDAWNASVPTVALGANEQMIAWRDGVSGLTFTRDSIVLFDDARIES